MEQKMSKINTQAVMNVIEEILRAFAQTLRHGLRLVRRMSPQALLGAALILAFIFTILPLALVLFAFLLLLKIAVGAFVIGGRRQRRHQEHEQ
jgi:F0F1-type ATP synthase membrane subunit a